MVRNKNQIYSRVIVISQRSNNNNTAVACRGQRCQQNGIQIALRKWKFILQEHESWLAFDKEIGLSFMEELKREKTERQKLDTNIKVSMMRHVSEW